MQLTRILLLYNWRPYQMTQQQKGLVMSMLQLLGSTKSLWYLGGEPAHIQQLQSQDTGMTGVPAIHFPNAVWVERYKSRLLDPSADAMQPSALWIGTVWLSLLLRLLCKCLTWHLTPNDHSRVSQSLCCCGRNTGMVTCRSHHCLRMCLAKHADTCLCPTAIVSSHQPT